MTEDTGPTTETPEGEADAPESPFVMKLSLSVLDDLGVNLYSNTAAVLSEAVAKRVGRGCRGGAHHHR